MSRFDERFSEHPIFNTLENLSSTLKELNIDSSQPRELEEVQRLEDAINYISAILKNVDSHLVSPNTINSINQHLQKVLPELRNFSNNENIGHLTNANNHLDTALHTVKLIPYISDELTTEQVRENITSFRRSTGQLLNNITGDVDSLKANIDELKNEIEKERNKITNQAERIDKAVSQFQEQFSESEDRRRESFTKTTEERETKFNNKISKLDEEVRANIGKLETDFSDFLSKNQEMANNSIEALKDSKDEAAEIVNIIGNSGKAGQYKKTSDEDKEAADFWRIVTVVSMIGIIIAALSLIIWPVENDWTAFATRVFLSGAFGIIATYAARESIQHRKKARINRKLALELAALNPYLALLPKDEQKKVKVNLADRFFGQPIDENQNEDYSAIPLIEAIKKALDKIPNQ